MSQKSSERQTEKRSKDRCDDEIHCGIRDALSGGKTVNTHNGELSGLPLDISHGEVCHNETGHNRGDKEHEPDDEVERCCELPDHVSFCGGIVDLY